MALIGTRTALMILYCVAIGGVAFALCRPDDPEAHRFEVVRSMTVNHVVQPGELKALREDGEAEATKLTGLFARSDMRGGQFVRSEDFSDLPLLHVPNRTIVKIPVQGPVQGANAGSAFMLCKTDPPITEPVTATALLCEGSGAGRKNCSVLAALPLQDARNILNQKTAAVAALSKVECDATSDAQRPQRPGRPGR